MEYRPLFRKRASKAWVSKLRGQAVRIFTTLFCIWISASISHSAVEGCAYVCLRSGPEVHSSKIRYGQGLYQSLQSVGVKNSTALNIINALRDEVEFSKLKVGDSLQARYENNKLVEFTYSQVPSEKHILKYDSDNNSWKYTFEEKPTDWYLRTIKGELRRGSNLEADLLAQGLSRSVVNEIIQVLLCKVNFRSYARMGDQYKVLLSEKFFRKELIDTKVLFTSYMGRRAGKHEAFFYQDAEKGSTYTAHYTQDGQALINAGLRYPLRRLHVRSSFGWRRHPVTGKRAMHRGVDLRGRRGDPVYAVASGKVILSSFNKYAGNKVGIKHKDGSSSYYYHLKKRNVRKGQWVRSHQIIGTVGATGRVTGPHLHFGFKTRRGKWMNPLNKRMIATPKLKGERLLALKGQVDSIKGTLVDLELSQTAKYLVQDIPKTKRKRGFYWPNIFSSIENTFEKKTNQTTGG